MTVLAGKSGGIAGATRSSICKAKDAARSKHQIESGWARLAIAAHGQTPRLRASHSEKVEVANERRGLRWLSEGEISILGMGSKPRPRDLDPRLASIPWRHSRLDAPWLQFGA
ncbi:predicted protein [Histoplasma capsulatum G186AR]|uniref:Uncharacterized protein n=1 Tax=Ajellomyces capsulatus (strain G186AR / H82 / ATCC MYA-2454 / RMSCC 2432) TaxID=447093 RepID=C0NMN1_AJECG|nr:uncharacterized protein HCBG_04008 [Histoplasma capsulatum G186AR]EEH07129.1 predicted protein [Histoplasma capsulatum G186AR]